MVELDKHELEYMALNFVGNEIEEMSSDDLRHVITLSQYITDRCLAEFERRGELKYHMGNPVVPYHSEHHVETILTRAEPGETLN